MNSFPLSHTLERTISLMSLETREIPILLSDPLPHIFLLFFPPLPGFFSYPGILWSVDSRFYVSPIFAPWPYGTRPPAFSSSSLLPLFFYTWKRLISFNDFFGGDSPVKSSLISPPICPRTDFKILKKLRFNLFRPTNPSTNIIFLKRFARLCLYFSLYLPVYSRLYFHSRHPHIYDSPTSQQLL